MRHEPGVSSPGTDACGDARPASLPVLYGHASPVLLGGCRASRWALLGWASGSPVLSPSWDGGTRPHSLREVTARVRCRHRPGWRIGAGVAASAASVYPMDGAPVIGFSYGHTFNTPFPFG